MSIPPRAISAIRASMLATASLVLVTLCLSLRSACAGEAAAPLVLFLIGEPEYQTGTTLPEFAAHELATRGLRWAVSTEDPADAQDFTGLDALATADLLVISVRRHTPSVAHLAAVRAHLAAGKPVIGIRTASHAFAAEPKDARHAAWPAFDGEVLGGSYQGHYDDVPAVLSLAPGAADHPLLVGIDPAAFAARKLYRNATLVPSATPLLLGRSQGESVVQNVAWVNQVGASRVFYTSMGMPSDFATPAFRKLLANAVFWTLARPIPADH